MILRISQAYTVESKFDSSDIFLNIAFKNLYSGELSDFKEPISSDILDSFLYSLTLSAHSYNNYIQGLNKDDIRLLFAAYEESQKSVEILFNNFYSQISNTRNKSY